MKPVTVLLFCLVLCCSSIKAQIITTVAGGGAVLGDGGPAISAQTPSPAFGGRDSMGNFYFGQNGVSRIRKIAPNGVITSVAGNGSVGFSGDGGLATAAQIHAQGFAVDMAGNIFIADYYNNRLRKVDVSTGIIQTISGDGTLSSAGDGGAASAATLVAVDVCVDSAGNIFVSDNQGQSIRKIDASGIITTIAPIAALGMAFDRRGRLVLGGSTRIFRLDTATGILDTIAGTGLAAYSGDNIPATAANLKAMDLDIDDTGSIYVADLYNHRIRQIDTFGVIHTVAGTGVLGFSGDGGPATAAQVYMPEGVTVDKCGNLLVSDCANNRIRKVIFNAPIVPTVAISATPNDTVCTGVAVTFNATVASGGPSPIFQWYVNGTVVGTGSSYSYTPSNGDSIRCLVTGSDICSGSANSNTINMVVNPIIVPTVNVTPLPNDTVCAGTVVTYSSSVTGGGMADSYQWYVNGVPVGMGSSYSYIPANGDSIRCAYTSTSTCGGTVTINSNITHMVVNPLVIPVATITVAPNDTVCSGIAVTISAAVSGSAMAYTWYKNGTIMGGAGSTYTYVPTNGDSVRCVVSSAEGCTGSPMSISSNTINMVVPATVVPVIAITGITSASVGGTVTVNATVTGTSAYTIRWMNKGLLFNTTTAPVVTYIKTTGTDTITARVIPAGAVCFDSAVSNLHQVTVKKTGVDEVEPLKVEMYPNPVKEHVVISSSSVLAHVSLQDLTGRELLAMEATSQMADITLTGIAPGVYILKATDIYGLQTVERLIKQ